MVSAIFCVGCSDDAQPVVAGLPRAGQLRAVAHPHRARGGHAGHHHEHASDDAGLHEVDRITSCSLP